MRLHLTLLLGPGTGNSPEGQPGRHAGGGRGRGPIELDSSVDLSKDVRAEGRNDGWINRMDLLDRELEMEMG